MGGRMGVFVYLRELIHNQTCWVHVNRCSPKRAQRCSPTAFFALHFFFEKCLLTSAWEKALLAVFCPFFVIFFSENVCFGAYENRV